TDLRSVWNEQLVGARANHSWLHADSFAAIFNVQLAPMPRNLDQQSIGDRLARQAGTRRAKRHGDSRALAELEERLDFLKALGLNHGFGNQAIEAGVRGVSDEVDRTNENAAAVDLRRERRLDFGGRCRGRSQNSCSHDDRFPTPNIPMSAGIDAHWKLRTLQTRITNSVV